MAAYKRSLGDLIFDIFNIVFLGLISLTMIFPIWNVIMTSLVDVGEYYSRPFILWPKDLYTMSYRYIFIDNQIYNSILVTVFTTVVGTLYALFITTMLAYGLSKKYLVGRSFFLILIFITMYFSGGMIPYYLLIKNLHLMDKLAVLILPAGVSTWNFLVIKSFFSQIPESLEESAKIDGANDLVVLIRIIIPISLPLLATMALFWGVSFWNTWFPVMLYIRNPKFYTLQYLLRRMLVDNAGNGAMDTLSRQAGLGVKDKLFDEGIKMAMVVIATLPIVIVYPFLQKYFAKGVMIGSIKG